jgi:TetR/AcrR family transcriptional regulator, mexJK operon transcriptional repressor
MAALDDLSMSANDTARSTRAATQPRRPRGRPSLSNEELLDTSLDIFLEKGFERTTIDAITEAAGVAKRTVYLRYGDKKALFKAALQRAIKEWIIPVEQLRAAETPDLEETLLKLGRILVANLMTRAGLRLLRITNAESGRMPEIGAYTYERGTEPTIAYLADLFRRRVPVRLEPAEAEEAAVAFLYLVVSGPPTMTAWGRVLESSAIDSHTRYCVRLFLHGLLPRDRVGRGLGGSTQAAVTVESRPADLGSATAHLETENRRLRNLLVQAMLELSVLKEQQGKA